jgi:hypothetical protein
LVRGIAVLVAVRGIAVLVAVRGAAVLVAVRGIARSSTCTSCLGYNSDTV